MYKTLETIFDKFLQLDVGYTGDQQLLENLHSKALALNTFESERSNIRTSVGDKYLVYHGKTEQVISLSIAYIRIHFLI